MVRESGIPSTETDAQSGMRWQGCGGRERGVFPSMQNILVNFSLAGQPMKLKVLFKGGEGSHPTEGAV